jgi:hypothetical protein
MAKTAAEKIAKLTDKIAKLEEKIADKQVQVEKWQAKGWERWVASGLKKIQKWQLKIDKHNTEIRMLGGGTPQSLVTEEEAFLSQYMQQQPVPQRPPTLLYAGLFAVAMIGSAVLLKDK